MQQPQYLPTVTWFRPEKQVDLAAKVFERRPTDSIRRCAVVRWTLLPLLVHRRCAYRPIRSRDRHQACDRACYR